MRIIGFVEGANPKKGGLGLVGVPTILGSVAARGHEIALVVGGLPTPGREKFVVPDMDAAFARSEGSGTFGVVTFKTWPFWAFAPSVLWRVNRHIRTSDFVSLHSLYSFPVLAGYLLARIHKVPYGLWPHGVLGTVQRRFSVRKKWLYDFLITRRILNNAAVLFYSAPGERRETQQMGLRVPSVIIADGIDMAEFANLPPRGAFRAKYLNGHSGPLVVFIARLSAKKGVDLLMKAMALVSAARPHARLAVVGPPDPNSFLQRVRGWIEENGLTSIATVTGPVTPAEKLQALADADVFVLPSEAENFGFSVFEAMASSVPVVVSDTLDYAGAIATARAGFAVPREPKAFSDAILGLLADPQLRMETGQRGRELARSYSREQTGVDLARTIESVVRQNPLPDDLTGAIRAAEIRS